MNKKLVALMVLMGVASYSAVTFGRRHHKKMPKMSPQEVELNQLNNEIAQLEQELENMEAQCEETQGAQKRAVCQMANEELSAKGIKLMRLKAKRNNMSVQVDAMKEHAQAQMGKRRRRN